MDKPSNRFLIAAALALSLCGTNAIAAFDDGPPPSANEAHAFLAETFQRYAMGYVVWYGGRTTQNHRGRAGYYGGQDCHSEFGIERSGSAFAVDWSMISSIEISGTDGIYVMGQLARPAQHAGGRHYTNFHIYSPDARVSRSVWNAFEVLRSSCQRRSRFD
jgi:hypothetical protein